MDNITKKFLNDSNSVGLNQIGLIPIKIMLSVVNLMFNSLVIVLVLFVIKAKTFSNMIFMTSAISDLFIGIISVPSMIISTTYDHWPLGQPMCLFWLITDFTSGSVSVYSYLTIAMHRYLLFRSPFKQNENMNRIRWGFIIGICVTCCLFWSISIGIIKSNDKNTSTCDFTYKFVYIIFADIIGYILPVFGVFAVNTVFLFELMKYKNKRLDNIKNKPSVTKINTNAPLRTISRRKTKKENANINMKSNYKHKIHIEKETRAIICLTVCTGALCVLFSLFCVCWPYKAYSSENVDNLVYDISYWLCYLYSSINPILLIVFNEKFRNEIRHYFTKNKNKT